MSPTEHVAPGVRRIKLPLPLALSIVNVFLVEGAHGWALVDSGMHDPASTKVLDDALAEAGIRRTDVKRAFITHFHPDHFGASGALERDGTEIVMHKPEAEAAARTWGAGRDWDQSDWLARHGVDQKNKDEIDAAARKMRARVLAATNITTVEDGDTVDLCGRFTRAVWTPGHTDYHAVLVDDRDAVLFAGDHVLPRITSNVGWYSFSRPDPLGGYLEALERVATLPVTLVLPAHGDPFTDLKGRVAAILSHHAERLDRTASILERGPRTAWDVTRELFPHVSDPHQERFAAAETLAHLRHLEVTGRALQIEGAPVTWRLP